MIGQNN